MQDAVGQGYPEPESRRIFSPAPDIFARYVDT